MGRRTRTHSKIQELPKEILKQVHDLLIEPQVKYEDIRNFLQQKGYTVSISMVGRHADWFNEWCETEQLRDQASLIATDPATALNLEKMANTMMLTRLARAMKKEGFDITKNPKLMDAFAKLQASSVKREQFMTDVVKKVDKAAADVTAIAKKNGLSESAAGQIRNKILGIK